MNWGWKIIKPFSHAIFWLTVQLHKFIPNYGVVIIVISILIKLVTFPLTRKSLKSMAAMKNLAPKMEELKAKYKSDPQKLNQSIMKLYKEEGVNPFSGCLLLLPQMPLLYGLYTVFSSTIEFRQAYFIGLWPDLSQPDPFPYIMPIIMTLAMFFQQKMSDHRSQAEDAGVLDAGDVLLLHEGTSGWIGIVLVNVLDTLDRRAVVD